MLNCPRNPVVVPKLRSFRACLGGLRMRALRTTFFGVLLLTASLVVARVFMSMGFVAGSIGQSLALMSSPGEAQHILKDAIQGFQSLGRTMNPQAGYRRTISVLDVPSEIEARRKNLGSETLQSGPLIIHIGSK